jgi:hypothetical protein
MIDIALLLLGGGLLAVAAGLTTVLLRPDSALDAAISFGVVAAAGLAATVLTVGALGILTPAAVLAAEAAWGLVAAAPVFRRGVSLRRPRLPRPDVRSHPWATALVTLAALALAWQLLVALVLPPFAFDALTYHLTIAASWVQNENLDPSALSLCCAYYPANSELIFAWPMLLLGSDGAVDLVQFGFVALGALSVAGIVRSAGLPAAAAATGAGLFAATPIVIVQAPTDYADVIVAASALAGLHALTRFAVTGAWPRLVVAGLAAGVLLGTKGTGVIWAAALAATALAIAIGLVRSGRVPARPAARALAAFLIPCLALGSYWYARNWIETDNPAYPFAVDVAGVDLFDGPIRVDDVLTEPDAGGDEAWPSAIVRSWAADLDFWRQGSYEYQQRSGGLGPLWPWLALPLLVPVTVALVRRRSPALIAVAVVAVVLVVQPYGWWSRFTIPLMAIGALAIVAATEWAPRLWMRRAVQALALALALAGVALSSFEVDPAARAEPLPARDLVGLIGDASEERTVGRLFFGEYRFLEQVPEDATVVVDLAAPTVRFVYPLFGPEGSRDVRPAGASQVPDEAWVVTAADRPLDRALSSDPRFSLAAAERGVRVWRPVA